MNDVVHVLATTEARSQLPAAVSRFRREGVLADMIVFGGHRKPEGVVMPYALYERLLPAIEDAVLAEVVRVRLDDPAPSESFGEVVTGLGFNAADFE